MNEQPLSDAEQQALETLGNAPGKLRLLADWFDWYDKCQESSVINPSADPEDAELNQVQLDLRRWADAIAALLRGGAP